MWTALIHIKCVKEVVMQLAAKETLRCADIVEEMFVNLHECIDKKTKISKMNLRVHGHCRSIMCCAV